MVFAEAMSHPIPRSQRRFTSRGACLGAGLEERRSRLATGAKEPGVACELEGA